MIKPSSALLATAALVLLACGGGSPQQGSGGTTSSHAGGSHAGGSGGASTTSSLGDAGTGGSGGDAAAPGPTMLVAPPVVKINARIESMRDVKAPMLAAVGGRVLLAGSVAITDPDVDGQATVREKAAGDAEFGAPEVLGDARGQPDYAGTSIHAERDGSVSVAFIDQSDEAARPNTIWIARRAPGGSFGAPEKVVGGPDASVLRFFVDTTSSAGHGQFVFWDEDAHVRFSRSTGGAWSTPALTYPEGPGTFMRAATLPDGRPLFVHAWDGAWAGVWDGSAAFGREAIKGVNDGTFLAGPSIAVLSDGRALAAFRAVEGGVWVAERSTTGAWALAKAAEGTAFGAVAIVADEHGFAHLLWSTDTQVRYSVRPPAGAWSAPVDASIPHFHNGAWAAVTWEGSVLRAHAVTEDFEEGMPMVTRYVMFEATGQ